MQTCVQREKTDEWDGLTSGAMQTEVFQYFAGEKGEKPVAIGGRGACETGQAKRSSTL